MNVRHWFCFAALGVSASAATIYDNGPLVTHPGGGPGGADASRVQTVSLGFSTLGFTASNTGSFRLADDFPVTGAGWQVDSITVFAYQTGSTTTSTFNFGSLQIWDGIPGAGGAIIFGDTTTNRLLATTFSNIYRDTETSTGNSQRPIMANTLTVGMFLTPGVYWIDYNLGGTLASGPFSAPISILGQVTTGDALQFNGTSWVPIDDTSAGTQLQGIPFLVNSSTSQLPEPSSFLLAAAGILAASLVRRRG